MPLVFQSPDGTSVTPAAGSNSADISLPTVGGSVVDPPGGSQSSATGRGQQPVACPLPSPASPSVAQVPCVRFRFPTDGDQRCVCSNVIPLLACTTMPFGLKASGLPFAD